MNTTQSSNGGANSDSERDSELKEWEKARGTLEFFDGKLHDLRIFGFGFITALLAADGILLSTKVAEGASAAIKFGVFGVTLILLLAIQFIDNNYTIFQEATVTRVLVIERKLNIELSDIIDERYRSFHNHRRVISLYVAFNVSTILLGFFSLYPEEGWIFYSSVLFLFALGCTIYTYIHPITYRCIYISKGDDKKKKEMSPEDWTISTLECHHEEGTVKLTLSNIGTKTRKIKELIEDKTISEDDAKKQFGDNFCKEFPIPVPITFKNDEFLWKIVNEETGEIPIEKKATKKMYVYDSYTWVLKGSEFKENGIYQVWPRGWYQPLHRRIVISCFGPEPNARVGDIVKPNEQ